METASLRGRRSVSPARHARRRLHRSAVIARARSRPPSRAALPTTAPTAPARRIALRSSSPATPPAAITGRPDRTTRLHDPDVGAPEPSDTVHRRDQEPRRPAGDEPPERLGQRKIDRHRTSRSDPPLIDLDAHDDAARERLDRSQGVRFVREGSRAEHHTARPGVEHRADLLTGPDAPAGLHPDVHLRDRTDHAQVVGTTAEREVGVDDVEPAGPRGDGGARGRDRITVVRRRRCRTVGRDDRQPTCGEVERRDHLERHGRTPYRPPLP